MKNEKKFLYLGVLAIGLLVAGVSPVFLLLLACPVMMFMMHGKNHGAGHASERPTEEHDKERRIT